MKTDKSNGADKVGGTSRVSSDSQLSTLNSKPAGDNDAMPNGCRLYVAGILHRYIRVPSFVMSSEVETSLSISGGL
jgi:hypothetical protein